MPEFAPLVTRSPVMQKDFLPLTSRPVSRPDGWEPVESPEVPHGPSRQEDPVPIGSEEKVGDIVGDGIVEPHESEGETSGDEAVVRELTLSAPPLECGHKPVISLHRSGDNPGKVTGLRIVCRCGDVIDVSFEADPAKAPSSISGEDMHPDHEAVASKTVGPEIENREFPDGSDGDPADPNPSQETSQQESV